MFRLSTIFGVVVACSLLMAGGISADGPIQLTSSDGFPSMSPAIATDAAGDFYIAWVDERDGNKEIYFLKTDPLGNVILSPMNISGTSGSSSKPHIDVDAVGNAHIAWKEGESINGGSIILSRVDAFGTEYLDNLEISSSNSKWLAVAAYGNGECWVGYQKKKVLFFPIYSSHIDASGIITCNSEVNSTLIEVDNHVTVDASPSGQTWASYITIGSSFEKFVPLQFWDENCTSLCALCDGGCEWFSDNSLNHTSITIPKDNFGYLVFDYVDESSRNVYTIIDCDEIALVSETPGLSVNPEVSAAHGQEIAWVTWQDDSNDSWEIWVRREDRSEAGMIISAGPGDSQEPDIAASDSDIWGVVWQNDGSGEWELFFGTTELNDVARVRGSVIDEFNARPVGGATVRVVDEATETQVYTAVTPPEGVFSITIPGGSTYRLEVAHPGYYDAVPVNLGPIAPGERKGVRRAVQLETKTVVLVHGVCSDHKMWLKEDENDDSDISFADTLERIGGYYIDASVDLVPLRILWSSSQGGVRKQARVLARHLDKLSQEGIRSGHIVAHSMGGLVARYYLISSSRPWGIKSLVMLGTPNHGSELANGTLNAVIGTVLCSFLPEPWIPQAIQDLRPGSSVLRDVNYDGGLSRDNRDCRIHDLESTLSTRTTFVTYRGTVYDEEQGDKCGDRIRDWLGAKLARETNCPVNDQIVPWNSVPLQLGSEEDNVANWSDEECGCTSRHLESANCTQMAEDPCVVGAVHRVLKKKPEPMCSGGVDVSSRRGDYREASNIAVEPLALAPGESDSLIADVGTADSLLFEAIAIRGDLTLSLRDPSGRPITADTAAVDSDIDYRVSGPERVYIVRNGLSGAWHALISSAMSDSLLGLVSATEYSDVTAQVLVDNTDLQVGETQRVLLELDSRAGPILGATAEAIVQRIGASVADTLSLHDDGTRGDDVPGDGIYTTTLDPAVGEGLYDVVTHAESSFDQQVLNRTVRTYFLVENRPDVEVRGSDIALSERWIFPDRDNVTVTTTIRNTGSGDADSVWIRFLEKDTNVGFGDTTVSKIRPGEEVTVSAVWPVRRIWGGYELGVEAMVLGDGVEVDVGDNSAFRRIGFVDADQAEPRGVKLETGREPGRSVDVALGEPGSASLTSLAVVGSPSNRGVTIQLGLARGEYVGLVIYDVAGRRVKTLKSGWLEGGTRTVDWDGRDEVGAGVASGTYFARLTTPQGTRLVKFVVIR